MSLGWSALLAKVQRTRRHKQLWRLRRGGHPCLTNRKVCKRVCWVLVSGPRIPSGLTCFGIFALSWGLRWNRGRHVFKTNASFLHSTQLNEVLLAMILRAVSTNLYTGTLCRHPLCCNTKILDHVFIFCLFPFVFFFFVLCLPPLKKPSFSNNYLKKQNEN